MCKNIKTISDVITKEEIDKFEQNIPVFVEAPTGRGKSHFIKHTLSEYVKDKKILILVNRKIIKNQSEKELNREDIGNITITTYQNLSDKILRRKAAEFNGYDYIISDECHFYCQESVFVFNTDVAFEWVMNQNAIKIFMTATADYIKSYLEDKLKLELKYYHIDNTYDFIDRLYFYQDDDVIKKLLIDLPSDEKAIYFTSAKKAHEMSELLESCVFYCSKNNYEFSKYTDTDIIKYIEENEKFNEQILCTTKVMDCGVNIIDSALKHIIVDSADIASIIQCIGRKRIRGDEKIIVYIKDKKGNAISRKLESIDNKLKFANILLEKGTLKLVEDNAHQNTYGNLIYDIINPSTLQIDKKINELMYFTYCKDKDVYSDILENIQDGFKLKLLERMCIPDMKYTYLEEELDALKLEDILNKLVDVKMFKNEQVEFKILLLKELLNTPKGSHNSIGLKTINSLFEENELNYIMNSKREKSGENRDKTYWVISKL